MDDAIRVLTIFSQSTPLAFIVLFICGGIVVFYALRRGFRVIDRQKEIDQLKLRETISDLQYRLNKQIEHKGTE